jgi:D-alanine-D-alanine ligase
MKIGLTYDLRSEYLSMGYSEEETAEFDKEETIDGIETALQNLGYDTERIGHHQALMRQLLEGKTWDMVFNICEGMFGDGRESLVPALLDAWQIPYVFSGPATLAVSLNKALCKHIIRDSGIPTPDFCIVSSPADLDKKKPDFPLFVKPISEGTGKGISEHSLVNTDDEFKTACTDLLNRFRQPVLVETYLPGREFTAGIVGNGDDARVIGVMEIIFHPDVPEIYSFYNKANYEDTVSYQNVSGKLYDQCAKIALQAWNAIGAFDAGRVDLKANEKGKPEFMEINPLAGLNLYHSDLPILAHMNGINFQQLIAEIMRTAEKRIFKKG